MTRARLRRLALLALIASTLAFVAIPVAVLLVCADAIQPATMPIR